MKSERIDETTIESKIAEENLKPLPELCESEESPPEVRLSDTVMQAYRRARTAGKVQDGINRKMVDEIRGVREGSHTDDDTPSTINRDTVQTGLDLF